MTGTRASSRRFFFLVSALTAALYLGACGGGDGSPTAPGNDSGGTDGTGGTGGETRSIKEDPSFKQDVFEIFTRKGCTASSCHGGGAGGLTMTSSSGAYAALVGVASSTGETYVIPNDASNSYLVKKLEGRQSSGSRMPLGGTPLDSIDMGNVKNWINKGAKNN
ncbi:MAG: hypothetical protein ACE5GJ_05265 [Gemmatimonadota bacterium]